VNVGADNAEIVFFFPGCSGVDGIGLGTGNCLPGWLEKSKAQNGTVDRG
jgi:hypothetical protein